VIQCLALESYQIQCSSGKSYIRQTSMSFKAQLKEHVIDIAHNQVLKSALDEHSFNTKHLIIFD